MQDLELTDILVYGKLLGKNEYLRNAWNQKVITKLNREKEGINIGKAPAFQFYVKDWLSDPQLQCVSASSRGIWIDALCFMWEAPERGKLTGTAEELAKLLRATNGDFTQFMEDLKRHNFADVTVTEKPCGNPVENDVELNKRAEKHADIASCNKIVTLTNRRMFREQNTRENTRLRVRNLRAKPKCNINVTPPSSSSSPNIIKNKDLNLDVTLQIQPPTSIKRWYKNEQGNYVCYQCQKSFMAYQKLQDHLATHKGA